MMVSKVQTAVGMDPEELQQLRTENEQLRTQLISLSQGSQKSQRTNSGLSERNERQAIMKIAMKFDVERNQGETINPSDYKRSSRELQEESLTQDEL
jgi:hypothetical protein